MRALFAWRGGLFLTEGEIGVLSVSSLFSTRGGVYVGVCVCIRTHTHTLHIRVLGREPRGKTKTRHIYIRMCTKYTRVCICSEAGSDLGITAFVFNIFFLSKKKSRRCEHETTDNLYLK